MKHAAMLFLAFVLGFACGVLAQHFLEAWGSPPDILDCIEEESCPELDAFSEPKFKDEVDLLRKGLIRRPITYFILPKRTRWAT